jgi:hypothetical protein
MKLLLTTAAVLLSFSVNAFAAETSTGSANESKANLTNITNAEAPAKGKDLDAEVTDIKLRADSGKKSKYSTSFFLTYSGGSLSNPGDDVRPNVTGGRAVAPVMLSGNVGVRYRKDKNNSFYAATGIARARPFHSREGDEDWEVSTPHIVYNRTHGISDLQISSNYRLYFMTEDRFTDLGQNVTVGYSLVAKNKIANTRFSGGVSMNIGYNFYDGREISLAKVKAKYGRRYSQYTDIEQLQPDYTFSLSPAIQYQVNDYVYAYTSFSLLSHTHYKADKPFRMSNENVTQSLGASAALSRDFVLSPYVTFEPENTSRDRTAVNLGATINL